MDTDATPPTDPDTERDPEPEPEPELELELELELEPANTNAARLPAPPTGILPPPVDGTDEAFVAWLRSLVAPDGTIRVPRLVVTDPDGNIVGDGAGADPGSITCRPELVAGQHGRRRGVLSGPSTAPSGVGAVNARPRTWLATRVRELRAEVKPTRSTPIDSTGWCASRARTGSTDQQQGTRPVTHFESGPAPFQGLHDHACHYLGLHSSPCP